MSPLRIENYQAADYGCDTCGAAAGQPCLTIRDGFTGPKRSYRGKGMPADHFHNNRLMKLPSPAVPSPLTDAPEEQT